MHLAYEIFGWVRSRLSDRGEYHSREEVLDWPSVMGLSGLEAGAS